LLLAGILFFSRSFAQESSIRFFGNGYLAPGADRIRVPLHDLQGANVSGDFTIECWLRCESAQNEGNVSAADHGDGWITGNVFLDRDVYGHADPGDFGFSIGTAPGLPAHVKVVAFGINRKGKGITIRGSTHIADNQWHHVALTRNAGTGEIRLYIDGRQDAVGTGPAGDIHYQPGRTTLYPESDPYLVIGAEKHDGGGAYPSYNGSMDELRISRSVRYHSGFVPQATPFRTDSLTTALFHFDENGGEIVKNEAVTEGPASHGTIRKGGDPAGPVWQPDSPFMDPLASVLREFRILKEKNSIRLSWTSGMLPHPSFFEIQRSRDGKNYSVIEKVMADPHCTSCSYTYLDTHPFEGKNYYRVRLAGTGRGANLTPAEMVTLQSRVQPYSIYQEGDDLVIRNNSVVENLVVWNSEGKRLLEKKMIRPGTTRLRMGRSGGIAFIHITLDDGTRFTEKILLR
jgi:hypothetical protein